MSKRIYAKTYMTEKCQQKLMRHETDLIQREAAKLPVARQRNDKPVGQGRLIPGIREGGVWSQHIHLVEALVLAASATCWSDKWHAGQMKT